LHEQVCDEQDWIEKLGEREDANVSLKEREWDIGALLKLLPRQPTNSTLPLLCFLIVYYTLYTVYKARTHLKLGMSWYLT